MKGGGEEFADKNLSLKIKYIMERIESKNDKIIKL